MAKLSLEKMNEIRKSKGFTYEKLSEATNIPLSTISKLFSGHSKNPSIKSIESIATALECSVDDFIEYKKEPVSPYYLDRQTGKLAQEIYDNRDLRILMDASKDLSPEDIAAIIEVANRLRKTKY